MQPITNKRFDKDTLERLIKTYSDISQAKRIRKDKPEFHFDLPQEVGIQLTHRCNLRCKHCFQWDHNGMFKNFDNDRQKAELDVDIVEKILKQTYTPNGNLYIWGGEPLIHSDWDKIAKLLENDTRWKVLSTNGLLIEEKMESFLRISDKLATIISIDGFEEEFDEIRGKGTYNKLFHNIEQLFELKKKNQYKGLITVNCVLNDNIIPRMYEFMEYYNDSNIIDTVYFTFPYYISSDTANKMDEYYNENFSWLNNIDSNKKPSWHSYNYSISSSKMEILKEQMLKLQQKKWNTRIRLQPPLEINDVDYFLKGTELTAQNRCECYTPSMRMDILADGKVSTCKLFPEFTIGNVYEKDIKEIWKSEKYRKYREIISKGLMPVCSQCIFLYLYGR